MCVSWRPGLLALLADLVPCGHVAVEAPAHDPGGRLSLGGLRSSVCQFVEGGEEVKEAARCVSGKSAWRVARARSRPPLASLGQHSLLEVPPLKNSARPMRLTGLIFALPPRRTRTVPRGGDSLSLHMEDPGGQDRVSAIRLPVLAMC